MISVPQTGDRFGHQLRILVKLNIIIICKIRSARDGVLKTRNSREKKPMANLYNIFDGGPQNLDFQIILRISIIHILCHEIPTSYIYRYTHSRRRISDFVTQICSGGELWSFVNQLLQFTQSTRYKFDKVYYLFTHIIFCANDRVCVGTRFYYDVLVSAGYTLQRFYVSVLNKICSNYLVCKMYNIIL